MKKIYLNTLKPEEVIRRLKNGEVVHMDSSDSVTYKMIDGIICYYYDNKAYNICSGFNIDDYAYYFESEEKFEITETGIYKTRDGQKVFIVDVEKGIAYGTFEGKHKIFKWLLSGSFGEDVPNELDIVSKWED